MLNKPFCDYIWQYKIIEKKNYLSLYFKIPHILKSLLFFGALKTFRPLLLELIEKLIELADCYSLHESALLWHETVIKLRHI